MGVFKKVANFSFKTTITAGLFLAGYNLFDSDDDGDFVKDVYKQTNELKQKENVGNQNDVPVSEAPVSEFINKPTIIAETGYLKSADFKDVELSNKDKYSYVEGARFSISNSQEEPLLVIYKDNESSPHFRFSLDYFNNPQSIDNSKDKLYGVDLEQVIVYKNGEKRSLLVKEYGDLVSQDKTGGALYRDIKKSIQIEGANSPYSVNHNKKNILTVNFKLDEKSNSIYTKYSFNDKFLRNLDSYLKQDPRYLFGASIDEVSVIKDGKKESIDSDVYKSLFMFNHNKVYQERVSLRLKDDNYYKALEYQKTLNP
ncbi:MAG: hypothetical protein N4A43_01295 [Alphaproteobacteria bacterium]|jgi:hypothetical protein|nr:hypothetical protein [Alphaproteobacteria bacterium]